MIPEINQPEKPEKDEQLAGDLLVGANAIHAFLVFLGMPEKTDPYYLRRASKKASKKAGGWPIGKTGGDSGALISSRTALSKHVQKLISS